MTTPALERLLYPPKDSTTSARAPMPAMGHLHQEMRRKGVTLQLLWYEYKQQHPEGFQYSYFCRQYREYLKKLNPVMRFHHRAGEKMFVDFAGQTVDIIERDTGEISDSPPVRRRPWGQQLHLCRGLPRGGSAELDHRPCPCL